MSDRLGRFCIGVALGGLSASLCAAVLTGSPGAVILVYLAQLPLFAAGLWLGTGSAVTAGLTGSVVLLAIGGLPPTALFAAFYAIPIALLVRQALLARHTSDSRLEWYPAGLLAAWLTGLGVVALGAIIMLLGGAAGLEGLVNTRLAPAIERLALESGTNGGQFRQLLALVTPGAVVASWMAMTATNGILAQGLLAWFGKAWRPSPELAALSLPVWPSLLLAAASIMTMLGGNSRFYGVNLLIVLAVPFCFAGLALLHAAVRRLARPQIPIVAFYVLAAVFGWPLLVITLLGVLEAPLGLRRRFAPLPSIGATNDD